MKTWINTTTDEELRLGLDQREMEKGQIDVQQQQLDVAES